MKLVTYVAETPFGPVDRLGALDGERVVDLSAAYEAEQLASRGHAAAVLARHVVPPSLIGLLQLEDIGMAAARVALDHARDVGGFSSPVKSVRLRAPLPRPNSLRDFMLVEEHVRGTGLQVPESGTRCRSTGRGTRTRSSGPRTRSAGRLHREARLRARDVDRDREAGARLSVEEAPAAIAGYTIFNDWSARDIQMREMALQLGPGLGKDFATLDGAVSRHAGRDRPVYSARWRLVSTARCGRSGTLGAMKFSFAEMVAHVSQEQTLMPGDVLGSGTIGRGCGLELDRWIKPGDVVELEVEGIGVLRNRVVRP